MAGRCSGAAADPAQALLLVRDLDGRLRGLGFLADRQGTVVTAHETVAGLDRVVLHTPGGQSRVLGAESIEALPGHGLALLRTESVGGLPGPALAIAAGAGEWPVLVVRDGEAGPLPGGVLGRAAAGYPWQDGFLTVPGALLLQPDRPGAPPPPAGAPVLDAETGAVLGVLAPGLRSSRPGVLTAAALRPDDPPEGALAELLERNAAQVPAFGRALNLAGLLQLGSVQLGTATAGPGRIAALAADRVDRPDGICGEEPQLPVTVLLGALGSGRTTEMAALVVRRTGGGRPLPTLWLRGGDLDPADDSLAAPVARALARAAGLLGVGAPEPGEAARIGTRARRPLLVVLDAPEEAPQTPPPGWLAASTEWLAATGARLLVAAGPDGWERLAGGRHEARVHWLGPLPADAAARAARRYGVPADRLGPAEAAHPLAVRLAGELVAAGVADPVPGRPELFAAHLDLGCLRVARRLAAGARPRRSGAHRRGAPPPASEDAGRVRRLAAVVAGRVHEAARLMLGTGHGALAAADFERLFPAAGGWGPAVLAEGLFVPAGPGFRMPHEEASDWLQSLHLDLDRALRLLLADGAPAGAGPAVHGVPRHRVGPVAAALDRLARTAGAPALDAWLHRLRQALEAAEPGSESDWWAGRLLAQVLPASPEPAVHLALLELLAERAERDARFGPGFWSALALQPAERLALIGRLVRADGSEQPFAAVAAELLTAAPRTVIPLLCDWFEVSEPAAALAGDLLLTHRRLALDDLTEVLVAAAHPRADRLLGLLAAEEPSALCRAVDRWSHDPRPERHVAAAVHALRTAPYATGSGQRLLRHTARVLLAREEEPALHGAALALLVRDPVTRAQVLAEALAAYRSDDPFVTAEVLAAALAERPEAVLTAFRERLGRPGAAAAPALRVLAEAADPAVARQGMLLVAELLRERADRAALLAGYLDRLLALGRDVRPLLAEVITAPPAARRALAVLLAVPADPERGRLLDALLAAERDQEVLAAVLEGLVERAAEYRPVRLRELVRRIGARWSGADALLVRCAGRSAGFALLLAEWPPQEPPPPGGPLLARMRALAAAGRDPQYAAAEAERGGPLPAPRAAAVPVPKPGRAHGTL
ncbi:serine protease [Kitasatospora sp. NPDC049258]|uniref:serine protease n=1 Tax=Kitasatospora sp. NPDC049258 TaxID=3155394 RepID=UPI003426E76A